MSYQWSITWVGSLLRIQSGKLCSLTSPHKICGIALPSPAPSHVHCTAAILWQSHELPVEYNLSTHYEGSGQVSCCDNGFRPSPLEISGIALHRPALSHVYCIAAILWQNHELPVEFKPSQLITKDLVRLSMFLDHSPRPCLTCVSLWDVMFNFARPAQSIQQQSCEILPL